MQLKQILRMNPTIPYVTNHHLVNDIFLNREHIDRFDFSNIGGRKISIACFVTKSMSVTFLYLHELYDCVIIFHYENNINSVCKFNYDVDNGTYSDRIVMDPESRFPKVSRKIIKQLHKLDIYSICKNNLYKSCINYNFLIKELLHKKYNF